jgi:hypothetical protein
VIGTWLSARPSLREKQLVYSFPSIDTMRQRITKIPSRKGSGAWEISSEDDGESSSLNGSNVHQAVPMYSPLGYQQSSALPAPPGSFPLSWHQNQYNNPDATLYARGDAPRSLTSFKSSDLPSLTPAFIPDSSYQTYVLSGRTVFRNQAKRQGLPLSKICCAKFCAIFSFVAVTFLIFVGILFDTQPLYIPGSLPKHIQYVEGSSQRTQTYYSITPSIRLLPASNAYKAAAFYLVTGCLCWAYAYNAHFWIYSKWFRRRYEEIPDTDSTVPTFHVPAPARSSSNGGGDFLLPTTVATTGSPSRRRAYPKGGSWPDRVAESIRANYNRARIYVVSTLPTSQEHRRTRRREAAGPKDV